MNKINNYNKEEHIQFIETLIKTEQVAVFINNMDISERSKVEQNDTLEYLYNRIIELQNNWNELKKFIDNGVYNSWYLYKLNTIQQYEDGIRATVYENVQNKMQEIESGNNE